MHRVTASIARVLGLYRETAEVVAPGPGGVAFVTAPNNPAFMNDHLGRVDYAGARFSL